MRVAEVQFAPWDRTYFFGLNGLDIEKNDKVIVKTDQGTELGEVVGFREIDDNIAKSKKEKEQEEGIGSGDEEVGGDNQNAESDDFEIKPITRLATANDIDKLPTLAEKEKALEYVKKSKEKLGLAMKFIDAHFSHDASRVTFAFIADGRVDFRELVKELTRHFGRTIRLQQIGIRDEARIMGDYGHCGKKLCCKGHLKELSSITSEMAELQQCSHRGSDRISGICGRLMCCLNYEQEGYNKLANNLPAIGTRVNVDGKKGVVVGRHVLKQTVDVEFSAKNGEDSVVVEVDINRKKKKEK